jgi:hypothetical protein
VIAHCDMGQWMFFRWPILVSTLRGADFIGFLVLAFSIAPFGVAGAGGVDFGLGISSTNYLGSGTDQRVDHFSTFDLYLDAKTEGPWIESRVFVQSQIGLNNSDYRFIELPEVYIATARPRASGVQASLGRKLVSWSELDRVWSTGAFQPRFRWDYLRPQPVGLLGGHLAYESPSIRAHLFYSPIFIPDRGAPLDFSEGRIRSVSPWMVNPPQTIEILRRQDSVRYEAAIPRVGEIIQQHSVAGHFSMGQERGSAFSASYAYKPMNQLLMSYTADLDLGSQGGARAILHPRVAYHHLATSDLSYSGERWTGSLSFMGDIPVDSSPALGETIQRAGRFFLVSPTLRWNPFAAKEQRRGERQGLSLSYLHAFGRDRPDDGAIFDGGGSEFDSRFPFKDAALFSMRLPKWRRFGADLKLLLDIRNPGTIVSWQLSYEPRKDWVMYFASDVLSSFSDRDSGGTNFIRRYRENDRFMGGVAHVF